MGLFSFLRRKKKGSGATGNSANLATPAIPVQQWHHTISHFYLETHPLGQTPATDLERQLLMNVLISLCGAISLHENEAQEITSAFFALSNELRVKAAEYECGVEKLEVIALTFDASHGYAARVSANSRKYTVLLGESSAVARASTPFNSDLQSFLKELESIEVKTSTYVLAIDGIAYAALSLQSELR